MGRDREGSTGGATLLPRGIGESPCSVTRQKPGLPVPLHFATTSVGFQPRVTSTWLSQHLSPRLAFALLLPCFLRFNLSTPTHRPFLQETFLCPLLRSATATTRSRGGSCPHCPSQFATTLPVVVTDVHLPSLTLSVTGARTVFALLTVVSPTQRP